MTRIFIYEYASARPSAAGMPESIRVEGRAMLTALVQDFFRIPGVEVLTLAGRFVDEERGAFRVLAGGVDWSVIIAPEFDGLLLERCRWVLEAGGRLLGPSPEIVDLTGDKWATYQLLKRHGIRTPCTWLDSLRARSVSEGNTSQRFVRKPRHGAGSHGIGLVHAAAGVEPRADLLTQEMVSGIPASVSFLAGPGGILPLLPGEQLLSTDGHFRYLGGKLPDRP